MMNIIRKSETGNNRFSAHEYGLHERYLLLKQLNDAVQDDFSSISDTVKDENNIINEDNNISECSSNSNCLRRILSKKEIR